MNIPVSLEHGGIAVRTVMSFLLSWFHYLGLIESDDETVFDRYHEICSQAAQMIKLGTVTAEDIAVLKTAHADVLDYDQLVVDEGQDWPQAEVDILKALYKPEGIIVADGIDQLVRGQRPDWMRAVPPEHRRIVKLERCLRMKANLAIFANAVADEAKLEWHVEPNDEAGGGRVILLEKPYSPGSKLHQDLTRLAREAGNSPIDFLFCVPPSDVHEREKKKSSSLASAIMDSSGAVWDATDEDVRKDFPRDANAYRVVQYASCRGLEGWVVVAEALDEFWDIQRRIARALPVPPESYKSGEEHATERAWHWSLIPLTRPIDTLVISLRDPDSEFSRTIKLAASRCPDAVEWFKA
jgi:hypothetical protein